MTKKTPELWKDIYTTTEESEAAIIVGVLNSAGIECRVESSKLSAFPVSVGKLGEVKVLVPIDEFEKAGMVLESASEEEEEEP